MTPRTIRIPIFALGLLLAACGGGGGGSAVPSPIAGPGSGSLGPASIAIMPPTGSLSFLGAGSTFVQTLSASEPGYSGSFTATSANAAIATVATASGTTFAVTPMGAGATTVRISDVSGHFTDVPISVTISPLQLH